MGRTKKRKRLLILVMAAVLCLAAVGLCGCAGEKEQVKLEKSVSKAMSYEELVQYCTETQGVSAFETEARLRQMQIGIHGETAQEQASYRVLSVPSGKDEDLCLTTFVAESEEKDGDWEIKAIKSAWVKSASDEELSYMGGITYWIRDKKSIEYVVNGDFYDTDDVTFELQEARGEKTGWVSYEPATEDDLRSRQCADIHGTEGFDDAAEEPVREPVKEE